MDTHQSLTVLVDGTAHALSFIVNDRTVCVYTDAGSKTVPLRGFEAPELAQIVALQLFSGGK